MIATMIAPKEPIPAASTGVAIPPKSNPSTKKTKKIGAMRFLNNLSFCTNETRSSRGRAGPSFGFNKVLNNT